MWREGLASWGQTPERIRKLKDSVDVAIYTPGSNIGLPLTVLKSFDAPPPEARDDAELIGDRVTGSVSGLLTSDGDRCRSDDVARAHPAFLDPEPPMA